MKGCFGKVSKVHTKNVSVYLSVVVWKSIRIPKSSLVPTRPFPTEGFTGHLAETQVVCPCVVKNLFDVQTAKGFSTGVPCIRTKNIKIVITSG